MRIRWYWTVKAPVDRPDGGGSRPVEKDIGYMKNPLLALESMEGVGSK